MVTLPVIEKNIPIPLSCVLCDVAIQPQQFLNGNVWELGHNAQPLADGRCCESCYERVIHTRIVSFDIGQVHFDKDGKGAKKIEHDGLEHKRQLMMSEGKDWNADEWDEDECE